MKSILFPLIFLLKAVYLSIVRICGSFGFSLLILSVVNSTVMLWLGSLISRYPKREALVQSLMAPKLAEIKKEPDAALRHAQTTALYRKYAYHPILALRSAVPLLLQLPFLFAAYHALSNLAALQGQSFTVFQDLSRPDALLYGINLLPILMSLVNVITALITPSFSLKDKLQAGVIAGLFFLLLYKAASALLIFWTMNNVIYLVKAIVDGREKGKGVRVTHVWGGISSYIEPALSFFGQYFILLSLFYLYQALALETGFVFGSFLKYVPLFIASTGLFVIQVLRLKQGFEPTLRYIMAVSVTGATLITIVAGAIIFSSGGLINSGINLAVRINIISYVIMLAAFIIGLFMPKREDQEEQLTPIGRVIIVIILSLIPAAHYAKVNAEYLMGSFKYIFFLVIPLIALINYILSWKIAGHSEKKSLLAIRSGVFSLLLIALPIIRFSLRLTSKVDIDFWVLLFVALLLLYFINSRKRATRFLQISGIVLLVFIVSGFFGKKTPPGALYPRKKLTQDMNSITFKENQNIYLFVYDGIPNERVFRDQGLPFEKLKHLLEEYKFTLYDDAYTLGNASLNSMGMMFDFSNKEIKGPEGRDIYAGNSWANLILRNNGYKSRFLLGNYYVANNAVTHTELFDEMFPTRTASSTHFDYFAVLMRGILQGEMRFDTKGLLDLEESDVQQRKHEVIKEDKSSSFIVNHYEWPGHSQNSGKCLPNETELWIEKLEIALELIEQDFDLIEKYDPNAIVIAIGDHGPSLLGDCYNLAAWKKEDITPELMWDRIGTLLAIRWPDKRKAAKFDEAIVTNQDVFPVVFSYLADDPEYLKYCPDKVFWGYATPTRSEIGFDRGKIILEK